MVVLGYFHILNKIIYFDWIRILGIYYWQSISMVNQWDIQDFIKFQGNFWLWPSNIVINLPPTQTEYAQKRSDRWVRKEIELKFLGNCLCIIMVIISGHDFGLCVCLFVCLRPMLLLWLSMQQAPMNGPGFKVGLTWYRGHVAIT